MQIDSTLTAIVIGLQAWSLREIVSLKVSIATINQQQETMKKQIELSRIVPLLIILACLLLTGCSSTGDAVGNILAAPGKLLDRAAQSITAVTTNVTTSTLNSGEIVTQTNLVVTPLPAATKSLTIAEQINEWLPPQISGPASVIFTGISGLLALAVRRRQRTINQHEETIETMSGDAMSIYDQLAATIRGVERSVKESKPVKETIAKEAAKAGVGDKLNASVQSMLP
jgi:hypothetical protein